MYAKPKFYGHPIPRGGSRSLAFDHLDGERLAQRFGYEVQRLEGLVVVVVDAAVVAGQHV